MADLIKKEDVMRIINAENAVVLINLKERSTDEVLCAIASQINGLQTTAKSGNRLIDADAFTEKYGNYYAEEGTAEGFIGTVGELIAKQPTIEAEPVRHAHWEFRDSDKKLLDEGMIPANMWCSYCGSHHDNDDYEDMYCSCCGAIMDGGAENA